MRDEEPPDSIVPGEASSLPLVSRPGVAGRVTMEALLTKEQEVLLLTVARILRARINETRVSANDDQDLWALDDALAPFAAKGEAPVNESGHG
jgi:hypothetical protein